MDKTEFFKTLAALENKSTHPIAKAISEYKKNEIQTFRADNIEEISGHGLKGKVNGKEVLAGNTKLLKKFNITYDSAIDEIVESIVVVAINRQYAGYVLIADEIKKRCTGSC